MNLKRWIAAMLAMVIALSVMGPMVPGVQAAEDAVYTVSAPEKDMNIQFWLDDAGVPWYRVVSLGQTLIEDSKLGLATSLGQLDSGLSLVGTPVMASGDSTWEPLVGEQSQIRDRWNETSFTLTQAETGLTFEIMMRAYDEGVAFRYVLPELPADQTSYTVTDEATQFVFQAGAKASLHVGGNQTVPNKYAVESLPSSTVQRPATVEFTDGQVLTVCEGNLSNYSVMTMTKSSTARALEANLFGAVTVDSDGPGVSPWRVLVIGGEPTELLENDVIIQNLNEPADEDTYQFSQWLEPGTCVRATTGLNNTAIKNVIDIASEHGIRYVLLDSGWYGPEYDPNADPRLDPAALDPDNEKDQILLENYFATTGGYNDTGEGVFNTNGNGFNQYGSLGDGGSLQVNVDIPALCEYGKEKNVGIILYVNKVFLPDTAKDADGNLRNRFTVDELFAYFEKWGVAGVKPGFVNVRSQQYEAYMEEVIEAAANHKLVMTIHDEYVTTGTERTFPNLMMTEGILGDEGIGRNSNPQVAEDITTIFTRNVQGPPDHTFSYPGKATKAYALASPIMFRSGMSVLYWYTNPSMVAAQDKDKLEIWDNMPTNWDESLFLEGSLYEYATTARKAGDSWYVGSLSAITRTLQIPLDFLDENVTYVANIYADGVDADPYAGWTTSATAAKSLQTLEIKNLLVTSETVLQRDLNYGFGYAVVLTPATQDQIDTLDAYNVFRQELELEIARSADITSGDYTQESFAAFEAALTSADAIMADASSTDAQMESARSDLLAARAALVTTAALTEAIAGTIYYTSYHYTAASFQTLADAVAAGQTLLDSGVFTQQQLDDACAAITAAVEGLEADPNRVLKNTVYLDELDYDTTTSYAHANAIKKKVDYYGSTLSLIVDGAEQIFDRGLMTHAQSEVYYNIEGMDLQIFEAYVGIDTVKASQGNVIFRVYGDGVLLYESAASGNGSQNAQYFSIPIAGVKELHLEANMAGSNDGDHAVWGDAKFLVYRDPNAGLAGITVDGTEISGFDPEQTEYFVQATDASAIPAVDGVPEEAEVSYTLKQAAAIPGCAEITVTKLGGDVVTYYVYLLQTQDSDYISDKSALITENTLYALNKDSTQGNKLALLGEDGNAVYYTKGIGTHAKTGTTSQVVYNIEGQGYDRFEGYVGMSYIKCQSDPRPSVNFKIYVDDESTPRFESGRMNYDTPQIYYNVDVRGAKKLTLVADPCGDQSADHGCWCDARFLKYTGIQQVSGVVDVNNTGLEKADICVELHEIVDGQIVELPVKTVRTDENGAYCITNVLAGEYALQIRAGENHLPASVQLQVVDADVTQDLTLQAPEYSISLLQSADAIVLTDRTAAVRDEDVTIYIRDVAPGKLLQSVSVTAKDGTDITATAAGEGYTFRMPAQSVTVQAQFADDESYAADQAAAAAIDEKIQAVGEVTLDKKAQIEAIRAEYEALSDGAKACVQKLALLEHYEYLLRNLDTVQDAEAAQAAAEEAQAAAEEAQAAAEEAQKAAEEAAASAAEDKTAAENAKTAAEAAQKLAEDAQAAAEAARAAAETAATAAEESNVKAAQEAAKAAQDASAAAVSANAAATSAADAAEAARNAQAAQAAAEAAQAAAEEAAASAAEDKTAAEAAQSAAEAAQTQAEAAKTAAETAQAAADAAAAAAEESNVEAAQEAALSAAAAAESAAAATAAADSAKTAAQSAQAAQAAQAAAEAAASQTAADKAAAEKAREDAQKAADQVELALARYNAMVALNDHADSLKEEATEVTLQSLAEAAEAARAAINEAEDAEAVEKALEEGKTEMENAVCPVRAFADVDMDAWYHAAVDYVLNEGIMNGNGDGTFAPDQALTRAMLVQILYNMEGRPTVEAESSFSDVKPDGWYHDAVVWAAENGIVKGYDNGAFGAQDNVTREQMVTIIWRYVGEPECTAQEILFADSSQISQWAKAAVMWAYEAGIVQGVGEDRFDPAGNSTRAAAAQIMLNYYG